MFEARVEPVTALPKTYHRERLRFPVKGSLFIAIVLFVFAFLDALNNLWLSPLILVVILGLLFLGGFFIISLYENSRTLTIYPDYVGEYSGGTGRWYWRLHYVIIDSIVTYYDKDEHLQALTLLSNSKQYNINHYENMNELLADLKKNLPEKVQITRERTNPVHISSRLVYILFPVLFLIVWRGFDLLFSQALVMLAFIFLNGVFWPKTINGIKMIRNTVVISGFVFEIIAVGGFLAFFNEYNRAFFSPSPCSWIGQYVNQSGCVRSIHDADSMSLFRDKQSGEHRLIWTRSNLVFSVPVNLLNRGKRDFFAHELSIRTAGVDEKWNRLYLLAFGFVGDFEGQSLDAPLVLQEDWTLLDAQTLEVIDRQVRYENSTFSQLTGIGVNAANEADDVKAQGWGISYEVDKYLVVFSNGVLKVWPRDGWEPETFHDSLDWVVSPPQIFIPESEPLFAIEGFSKIICAGFLQGGEQIYIQSSDRIATYDSASGDELFALSYTANHGCSVEPESNFIILQHGSRVNGREELESVEVWRATDWQFLVEIPFEKYNANAAISVSADGRYLAINNLANGYIFDLDILIPEMNGILQGDER